MGLTSRERRRVLVGYMLLAISVQGVGNRPGGSRRDRRRPKPHDLLCEPRERRGATLGNPLSKRVETVRMLRLI